MRYLTLFCLFASHAVLAASVQELVEMGVKLHDAGDYQQAVAVYQDALKIEPDNASVLYEMVFSYQAAGKNNECIDYSKKGLKLDSKYRNLFYAIKGSCHSQSGEYALALKTFEQGLNEFPDDSGLHFNIAVTLYNSSNTKKAISHFKETIRNSSTYTSPYYMLARSFDTAGYRVPAIYFYMQFVLLEPNTKRSTDASTRLFALMKNSLSKDEKGDVNISVNMDVPVDEGDFTSHDLMLSLGGAVDSTSASSGKNGVLPEVRTLSALVDVSRELDADNLQSTFTWRYAIQNMLSLEEKGNLEPLLYILASKAGLDGADIWLSKNEERLKSLYVHRQNLPSLAEAD